MSQSPGNLSETLVKRERDIGEQWVALQAAEDKRSSAGEQQDAARKSRDLLAAISSAVQTERLDNLSGPGWNRSKDEI